MSTSSLSTLRILLEEVKLVLHCKLECHLQVHITASYRGHHPIVSHLHSIYITFPAVPLFTFHLKSPTVPSGPPVNVTVKIESSTSIFISWQPPETLQQNGIITSYRIDVNSVIDPSQLYTYNTTSDALSFNVTGIGKFK